MLGFTCSLYALVDPRDRSEYRYIGLTRGVLSQRLMEHKTAARGGNNLPVYVWFRSVESAGFLPEIVEIECDVPATLAMERFYIEGYLELGHRLLNIVGAPERPEIEPEYYI